MGSTITHLLEGYKQFKQKHFDDEKLFDGLVKQGQQPKILFVACCDSRVDPAIVTGCQPGELFVVRNVANLVPPYDSDPRHHGTSAALEYAVLDLNISDIVIFGHSHCGGIHALMEASDEKDETSFLDMWMGIAKQAKKRVIEKYPNSSPEEQAYFCEKESLLTSLKNLNTFPWITERVQQKTLALHAWYFNLATGSIEAYQTETEKFIPLA